MCNFEQTGQGDTQRLNVPFTLWIIECSKFLNSSSVMSEASCVVPFINVLQLEQHPEETKLKVAPLGVGMRVTQTSILFRGPVQKISPLGK